MVVQREGRLSADDAAVALEELEADDAGHALLRAVDEGVERVAQRREPEAVVDDVGVLQADRPGEPVEVPRRDQLLQLLVRRVQHDGRRRLVDLRAT